MPDGNVHVVPVGEGQPEHDENKDCWCEPELSADYTHEGGRQVWVHKEIQ